MVSGELISKRNGSVSRSFAVYSRDVVFHVCWQKDVCILRNPDCPFQPSRSSPVAFAQEGFPFAREDQFVSASDTSLNCFLMNVVKEDTYFLLYFAFVKIPLDSAGFLRRCQVAGTLQFG